MTTVNQAKETQIFFIDYDTMMIGQSSLYDYVKEFESEDKQYTRYDEEEGVWYVDTHRVNRPSVRGRVNFEIEEEAEDDIFSKILEYDFSKSDGKYFHTEKEAEAEVIEIVQYGGHGDLDKEVAISVYNKMKLLYEKRAEKEAIQQAQWSAEQAVRNAEIERLLPIEVAAITIDELLQLMSNSRQR